MKKFLSLILLMLCLLLIFTSCTKRKHDPVEVKRVDATCTSIGYTEYYCDHCDQNYVSNLVDAMGHLYGEAVAVVEENCTTRGVYESTCARCGEVQRYSVSAKGHSYVEIANDDTTLAYECEICHDVVNIANDERIEDYIGATEIFDVETTFTFDVVSSEGEEYIRNNLKIIDSYFNGTEYEDDADVILQYVLTDNGNNTWSVSVPETYLYDTTYIAKLSGGVTFAEYKSKELSFTVVEDPNHENIYEYNSEIVFLKALENATGGYYPYDISLSEDSGNLHLIVNKIDGLSKGQIVCVGDVDSMEQITSDTECYFGVVGNSYQLTDGRWLVILSEPELQEIFKQFDISFNEDIDLSNANIDTAAIKDSIIESLYANDEFIEFLSVIKVSSESYIEANGYYSPNLIDTKTFLNSVSINPDIRFGGNMLKMTLGGLVELDINNSSGAKIGTLTVEFDLNLASEFKIDVNYDIKTQWMGIKLEKFDVAMTQNDSISFAFRVSVDSDEISSSGYVINKNTGEAHLACCVEVTRASDPSGFEQASKAQVMAAAEKCSRCKPENGASLENDFNGYYMNTLYCSDWEKVAADISKLTQVDKKSSRLEVELGSVEIPICGPVSANIGIGFAISFDAQAIMDYSYSYEQTSVYGMRLNYDYLQPYSQMSNGNVSQDQLAVLGEVEARVGLLIDTYINISGFEKWINAGVQAEVGTYAELSGVLDSANDYHGAYFEVGAYLDIDAHYKLIKKDGVTDLAEIKRALLKYGYEKLYFAYEKYEEKLNILGSYDIAANDILAVRYYDLINMVIKTDELSLKESYKYKVNLSFADGRYCEIKNGVIVYKLGAPRVFSDTLIITVTSNDDWKNYKKGSSVYYLGTYEIDFEFDTNHTHTWVDATCTAPKTCSGCGATEGAALGHSWTNATCTSPKACENCGATEGVALGHNWDNATCTAPKTCGICGATEGVALGHSWDNATCTVAKTCKTCGATEGSSLGHNWVDATCTSPKTCGTCGATEGTALGHTWVDATCTAPKTCSTCRITSGSALGHVESDWIIDREPTENESGSKHIECTVCGEYISVEPINPTASQGLKYTLNSDKQSYTVAGIGSCKDTNLIIPSKYNGLPVTIIGNNAFANGRFTSVSIPYTVKTINSGAFSNCTNFISITIPESVTSIGQYAFHKCTSLQNITIPESVTGIGSYAFSGCTSLNNVIVPDSVKSISDYAFSGCTALTSVTIGKSVTYLGKDAFVNCQSIQNVYYTGNVEGWLGISFANTRSNPLSYNSNLFFEEELVTNLVIPSSVTSIGKYAFYNCKSLTNVIIDNSVNTIIDEYSFYNCASITRVTIGDSVTSIGNFAFSDCVSLVSLKIGDSVRSINKCAFLRCSSLVDVKIPNSVTSIGGSAFAICTSLTSIVIPDSVTSFGTYIFQGCTSLTSAIIGNGVTTIDDGTFLDCTSLRSVMIGNAVTSIGSSAFDGCVSLESIVIPDSVTKIDYNAFIDCASLESVTLGNSVTSIGSSAFHGCSSLTSIIIPDSVTSIRERAFSNCTSLKSVVIGNSVTSIDFETFQNCTSLTNITIPDSVTSVGNSVFRGCTSLASIIIPDSVTSLGSGVFSNCTSLESIVLSNSITTIGDSNFYGCSSLINIKIPSSVISIGSSVFNGCTSLTNITIPDSVTSVDRNAFNNCTSLETVKMSNSMTIINEQTFYNCTSLTSVIIPDSVTSIGFMAFYGCTSLETVVIGNSVTSISNHAFGKCSALLNITIPNSITSIGEEAFYGCRSSKNIYYLGNIEEWLEISYGDSSYSLPTYYGANVYFDGVLVTNLIIPESITTISEYAFYNWDSLASVTIGDSVTSIGNAAFAFCDSLVSVTIGDSVTSIGNGAFCDCTSLTSVTIGDSVTVIYNEAFNGCISLASILIPDSVACIEEYVFYGCKALTIYCEADSQPYGWDSDWNISDWPVVWNVEDFGTTSDGLVWYQVNNEICIYKYIGNSSIVEIPSTIHGKKVTSIAKNSFYNCNSLTNLMIPDSVTSIGGYAFYYCNSLTSVIIPNSVKNIGEYTFFGCEALTIYCEAESKPTGWHYFWYDYGCPVVWGYKPE